jgi:hypothetical protein
MVSRQADSEDDNSESKMVRGDTGEDRMIRAQRPSCGDKIVLPLADNPGNRNPSLAAQAKLAHGTHY